MTDTRTILVVDDDDGYRWSLKNGLEHAGFVVVDADDGTSGLAKLAAGTVPDLIITDIHMKIMDGLEFLRAIRKVPMLESVPIFISSNDISYDSFTSDSDNVKSVGKDIAAIISLVGAKAVH